MEARLKRAGQAYAGGLDPKGGSGLSLLRLEAGFFGFVGMFASASRCNSDCSWLPLPRSHRTNRTPRPKNPRPHRTNRTRTLGSIRSVRSVGVRFVGIVHG